MQNNDILYDSLTERELYVGRLGLSPHYNLLSWTYGSLVSTRESGSEGKMFDSPEGEEIPAGKLVEVSLARSYVSTRLVKFWPQFLKNLTNHIKHAQQILDEINATNPTNPTELKLPDISYMTINFVPIMKIEDLGLLKEDHIKLGPFADALYYSAKPFNVAYGPDRISHENCQLSIGKLPNGAFGFLVKKVFVSHDEQFYGTLNKKLDKQPYYIVCITELFDLIKPGYYLVPTFETKFFVKESLQSFHNIKISTL